MGFAGSTADAAASVAASIGVVALSLGGAEVTDTVVHRSTACEVWGPVMEVDDDAVEPEFSATETASPGPPPTRGSTSRSAVVKTIAGKAKRPMLYTPMHRDAYPNFLRRPEAKLGARVRYPQYGGAEIGLYSPRTGGATSLSIRRKEDTILALQRCVL